MTVSATAIKPAVWYEPLAVCPQTGARLGRVHTPHGVFDTPAFMPVGTQGTLKGHLPSDIAAIGAQCVLANTYHLMLRPGEQTVAALGGLHKFMNWPGPILTDSGGFQVFSLGHINRIDDHGVTFKSHIDGATVDLTPERSIQVQNDLGADIIMAFDQCPAGDAPADIQRIAVDRTIAWAARSVRAHARTADQALFGIVQGGTDPRLREECAKHLIDLDLPGYALGGLAVGEGFEAMKHVLATSTHLLPSGKPRYLMGVGYPRDIAVAVASGIDMFDCVLPARNGRNAYAFVNGDVLRLRNNKYTQDTSPIQADCDCPACDTSKGVFTRGAIRHFFHANEMLGPILVSLHNQRFFQRFMADIRRAIAEGCFGRFLAEDPRCIQGPSPGSGGGEPSAEDA